MFLLTQAKLYFAMLLSEQQSHKYKHVFSATHTHSTGSAGIKYSAISLSLPPLSLCRYLNNLQAWIGNDTWRGRLLQVIVLGINVITHSSPRALEVFSKRAPIFSAVCNFEKSNAAKCAMSVCGKIILIKRCCAPHKRMKAWRFYAKRIGTEAVQTKAVQILYSTWISSDNDINLTSACKRWYILSLLILLWGVLGMRSGRIPEKRDLRWPGWWGKNN